MDTSIAVVEGKVEQLEREVNRLSSRIASLENDFARTSVHAPRSLTWEPPSVVASRNDRELPRQQPAKPAQPRQRAPPAQPSFAAVPFAAVPVEAVPVAAPAPRVLDLSPVQAALSDEAASRVTGAALPKRRVSLEERLGQNWLNKLGIVTLVTGLALLLGYQARTLGPAGKSVLGVLLAASMLAAGLVLERRERYRVFARAAIGGGWALLYFVAFALFHVPAMQVLHSQAADFALMLTVAGAMVLHSLRYRSQVVTSLAFLLAFFTVTISHITLFSLVAGAILAAGLMAVAFRERWFVLTLGGLAAVYANHLLWLYRVLPGGAQPGHAFPEFLPSAALLLCYWLMFRLFYVFRVPENEGDRVCSTLNVLLNSVALLGLLRYQSAHPEWAFGALLALGSAELALAFVARRGHRRAFLAQASIGSLLLLAAIPFHFGGADWSLMWLLQSELLFVAGLALREAVFRRLGVLSAFAGVAHLLIVGAMPVVALRQLAPDGSHHMMLAVAFVCTALFEWFNAECAVRRWPFLADEDFDRVALRGLSYLAALCAGVAAWLTLAGPWTLLPWLALALLLSSVADRLESADLAQQAELLGVAAVVRAALLNFPNWDRFSQQPRVVIVLVSSALLYAQMRRRTPSHLLRQESIEAAYTWAAAGLLSTLVWYALAPAAVAVAWSVLGVGLLETGLATRRAFFRQQGFVLLATSFVRLLFINAALAPAPRLYTMLPLAALYAFAYQRLDARDEPSRFDRPAAALSAWFALGTVGTLLFFSLRPEWVSIGGAGLAMAMLSLAGVLKRPLFLAQAMALVAVTAARTLAFNVLSAEPLSARFTEGRVFTVGVTCALLFAALPIAFSLRKQRLKREGHKAAWLERILDRPEQVLFFAPLVIVFALIPIELRAGMITVGWSTLGVVTFLFALAVGERSFRLAGLGVLLMGLGKILTIDIWHASPIDRYVTLIVMGAALLLVSFLYSRFRETILELL